MHPTLVPHQRLIANVEGAMNAVLVKGDAVGTTLYYGPGAGAEPTASAVVADLVDVRACIPPTPSTACRTWRSSPTSFPTRRSWRSATCRPAITCACGCRTGPACWPTPCARILADRDISIDAIIQKEPSEGAQQTDIILLTHRSVERRVVDAIARIEELPTVRGKVVRIRMEELN